ncbi:hypothetical protein Pelo_15766 [Pelomyxa schiedti]|nr:hypothetical protein Pelo_15766 [Pelomyxa schiedti]
MGKDSNKPFSQPHSTPSTSQSLPTRVFEMPMVYQEAHMFRAALSLPTTISIPFPPALAKQVWQAVQGKMATELGTRELPSFENINMGYTTPSGGDVTASTSLETFLADHGMICITVPAATSVPNTLSARLHELMKMNLVQKQAEEQNTSMQMKLDSILKQVEDSMQKKLDAALKQMEDSMQKKLEAALKQVEERDAHNITLQQQLQALPQYDALNLSAEIFTATLINIARQILCTPENGGNPKWSTVYNSDPSTFKLKWQQVYNLTEQHFDALMSKKLERNHKWHQAIFYNARETINGATTVLGEIEKAALNKLLDFHLQSSCGSQTQKSSL